MSKKHFIQLADMVRDNRAAFSDAAIEKLADFCRNQNPHFNRARFIDYINGNCGPCGGKR